MASPPSTTPAGQVSGEGYKKSLGRRHVQMIAIGGAIGVGLFMGSGGRLATTGPALVFSYLIAGGIAYLLMRALGELVMYRQTSGSVVSYAAELFGPKGAFISGWMYVLNWILSGIAELIAIGLYFQFFFPNVPVLASALCAVLLLVAINLFSAKAFAEFEFWAAFVKVAAILLFLAVGIYLVASNAQIGGHQASVGNLFIGEHGHGGMFPRGFFVAILALNSVIFAYNAIELVGVAAGEMEHPEQEVPTAIRSVILRILVFYVGSVALLAMLLPWNEYQAGQSPFVTVFERMGLGWIGGVMNLVVITAALSSCNSGLYSISRILRTMSLNGHAPKLLGRMNRNHVPAAGIITVASLFLAGVVLNIWLGASYAFDLALNLASIGALGTWGSIFACQLMLRRIKGRVSSLPMPGAPVTGWVGLGSLLAILVLLAFDTMAKDDGSVFHIGLYTVALVPALALALAIGWRFVRGRTRSVVEF